MSFPVLAVQPTYGPILDNEIAALALQLEELQQHEEGCKGKFPADRPPDVEVAFSSFQVELTAYKEFLIDLKFTHSIARAVDTDGQAVTELLRAESQAQEDRHFALQLSSNDAELENPPSPPPDLGLYLDQAATDRLRLADHYFNYDRESELDEKAGPSMTFALRQEDALEMLHALDSKCCACHETFRRSDVIEVPCKDVYCVDCLKTLFNRSTQDMSLFPPRCHQSPIHLDLISDHLTAEDLENFENAQIEFSTGDKTYCSTVNCGRFIPPNRITADEAQCLKCGQSTCIHCKNRFHLDDCPEDPSLQATLALAESSGWRRCCSCRALVQLRTGCNHMTCLCGAEFCYLCGKRWKSCSCAEFTEQFLYERAEEVVDRDFGPELRPRDRQNRIQQVQEDLVQYHECEHSRRFERILGGGRRGFRCEMCEARHWKYILQCRRCHVRVCEDCRRNRVR